jgi:enoyl-CoA hydratase/carnithine racemase
MTQPFPPGTVDVRIDQRAEGAIATVTVDNTAKLNIIGTRLMEHFITAVEPLIAREDLRAVVLTGAGDRAFIGGANINEMAALAPRTAEQFISLLQRCCQVLRDLPVPVIARIQGYCLGAGLEIAAACDLRVAASNSVFGMPEVKIGIPSVIEAALLPPLIGWGRTRELLMLGESIDAATAREWGLLQEVVAPDKLDAVIDAKLTAICAAGPNALRIQKRLMQQWENLPPREAIAAGIRAFVQAYDTDEPARMMGAFIQRRQNKR